MSSRMTRLAVTSAAIALLHTACTAPQPTASSGTVNEDTGLFPVRLSVAAGADGGAATGRSLRVPRGWTAQVWAKVGGARMAAWLPDGSLLVTTGSAGELVRLAPRDGRSPRIETLVDGLEDPQGVAVGEQGGRTIVVLGESSRLVAWDYGSGALSHRRVLLDDLPTGGHGGKFMAVKDGRVSFNVGSATNRDPVDRSASPERATIERVGLDGSGREVLATGVRNGEGLSFAPDGTLFAAVNQADQQPYPFRDDSGRFGTQDRAYINEHPNDQVTRITKGAELGWPYCVPDSRNRPGLLDLGYVNDPVNNPRGDALDCATVTRTQVGLPAHSAPIGFVFTRGSALPDAFDDGALITAHGSWNREPPRPPSVSYSAWDEASATLGRPRTIVAGFQNPDGTRWGRSVDAVPGPDGALYVTDDEAGLVYRIAPPAD